MAKPPKIQRDELAREFMLNEQNLGNLIYIEDWRLFYRFNGKYHARLTEQQIIQELARWMKNQYPLMGRTVAIWKEIYQMMEYLCETSRPDIYTPYIALDDCILNTNTLKTEPHNRECITSHYLPFSYEKMVMETPNFSRYIATTFVDDEKNFDSQLIYLIQQVLGYSLLNTIQPAKVFFCVGDGNNGKSLFLELVQALMGNDELINYDNIESLTTNRFTPANLIGKRINIVHDEESNNIKVDKLKTLITGEPITVERKFQASFSFRPNCKFFFATNQIPTFEKLSEGIKRRIVIIPFKNQFSLDNPERDTSLKDKLILELPGIFQFALEGAKKLAEDNFCFYVPDALRAEMREFDKEISSTVDFLDEHYLVSPEAFTSVGVLYSEYKGWCIDVNRRPVAKNRFAKETFLFSGVKFIKGNFPVRERGRNLRKRNYDDNE